MTPKPRDKRTPQGVRLPTPCADRLARLPQVDLAVWRNVRLAERAMAGDLRAAVEWLERHADNIPTENIIG
jgi:hypothetical protein